MEEHRITLSTEQMRQIARYEITFQDLLGDEAFDKDEIVCPEVYTFTLEDLSHAIRALKAADPTVGEFAEYWFSPIMTLWERFDLDRACGYMEEDDTPPELKGYEALNVSDSYRFDSVWTELYDAWEEEDDESRLSEVVDLDTCISDLDRYFANKGNPIGEWAFSEREKENYIRLFQDEVEVKRAEEPQLALARKFIDELCEKDNGVALNVKGYSCYGGDRLYPCDWNVSRDCMLRLFEKEDDPQYANTLGYIYYYGRCTGGVPEYEKAFRYFGIAAANGLYEGMYKLADMFWHGYACKQSERTARNLYGVVYEDSKKHFLQGDHANFADAALRMGNVWAKGIGEEVDLPEAYSCYLQADYAARLRAKDSDFFGNSTVVLNVRRALEETREKLPEDYFRETMEYDQPYLFQLLASGNNRCKLTRAVNGEGRCELIAERIATRSVPDPAPILLTIPRLSFCERTTRAALTPDVGAEIWFRDDTEQVRYDLCIWKYTESRSEFYYDDVLVAYVKSKRYRFFAPKEEAPSGPEYRLVSIRFSANGRTYDYLCEQEDVQPGDLVIVEGYDGETEVEVIRVVTKRESELPLPIDRYRKIVRKA